MSIHKIGRFLLFAVFAAILFTLITGCHQTVPVRLRVTGTGAAEYVPPSPPPPVEEPASPDYSWAEGEVFATGNGAPPSSAVNKAQARLMARQAAKLDALRNLTEQVQAVRVDSKTTVRDFITRSDEINTQVHGYLSGAQLVSEKELDDGSWEVRMKLPLQPLGEIIIPESPGPPPPQKPVTGPVTPAQSRLMAERAAKADAYRQLGEQLKGVYINSSTTVEDFMTRDDRIITRVEAIIRGARVTDRRFNRDGTVEVDMLLEHPDITQVVK